MAAVDPENLERGVPVLAVVAGTALFFNAEEGMAESKIWDRGSTGGSGLPTVGKGSKSGRQEDSSAMHMHPHYWGIEEEKPAQIAELRRIQNATGLAEQQNRRFILRPNMTWAEGVTKCTAVGTEVCEPQRICHARKKRGALNMLQVQREEETAAQGPIRASNWGCGEEGWLGSLEWLLEGCFVPAIGDAANKVWVRVRDCLVVEKPETAKLMTAVACCDKKTKKEKPETAKLMTAVACCDKKTNKVIAAHAPAIITAAMRGGNNALNTKSKKGLLGQAQTDSWANHPVVDDMRNSDPFMKTKMSGGKMKGFHEHVADKTKISGGKIKGFHEHVADKMKGFHEHVAVEAKEHLGLDLKNNSAVTTTIMGHVNSIKDSAATHYNNIVNKISSGAGSLSSTASALTKPKDAKDAAPPGSVSGVPRKMIPGSPFSKDKAGNKTGVAGIKGPPAAAMASMKPPPWSQP
ncbi:hypothetical protein T484DRAFT_1778549 [Baffinella frigidus]|nr:hypothetical protein T484DRAFT_1778549 [Cryptophyta sp. CCMP2293]